MDSEEAIEIIKNEVKCVIRADKSECKRDCANCDLVRPTEKILEAYSAAIQALQDTAS